MELKDWLVALVSFGSLTIAVLAFRRNRRIDSENLLFKYKSEGYVILLEKLTAVMDKILEEQKCLTVLVAISSKELIGELNDRAEHFDSLVSGFANDLIKHSLFFSKEINVELDSLNNFLYDTYGNNVERSVDGIRRDLLKHYEDFLMKADHLLELMREDLQIDKLNTSLSNRLKGRYF